MTAHSDTAAPVRRTGGTDRVREPAADVLLLLACMLAVIGTVVPDAWWSPRFSSPWAYIAASGLLLAAVCHRLDRRLGLAVAAVMLAACALFAPPQFHLWGDGALRLRNLEQGIGVWRAAPLEAGDYVLRRGLMSLGTGIRDTYRITGIAGGFLFLSGATLAVSGMKRGWAASSAWTFAAAQTGLVFFTGYIESYALVTGLAAFATGLALAGRSPSGIAASVLAGCSQHLMGVLIVPGFFVYLWRTGSRRLAILTGAGAAAAVLVAASAGGMAPMSEAAGGALPDPGMRLLLILFACPAFVLLPALLRRRPPLWATITAVLPACAFAFFPLERGEVVDWDLAAAFLAPVAVVLAPGLVVRRGAGAMVIAAACIMSGPRIGAFLDPVTSENRYVSAMEGDPSAIEEYAILQRERGSYAAAAELFEEAFEVSGNGRHLSQSSEALRLAGMPDRALETARTAAGLRPDVETVWLQLALSARDAGSTADALHAARRHAELFTDSPELWALALETAVFAEEVAAAREASDMALALGDSSIQVLVNSGIAAFMAGDTARAELLLLDACRRDPGNPLPHRNLAALYTATGDSAAARIQSSMAGM